LCEFAFVSGAGGTLVKLSEKGFIGVGVAESSEGISTAGFDTGFGNGGGSTTASALSSTVSICSNAKTA